MLARLRRPVLLPVVSVLGAGALAVSAARLTRVSLRDGPTWYTNYGLYGLQYGAPQVFKAIREELARSRTTQVLLSSVWANNPEPFLEFFLTRAERTRARIGDVETYLLYREPLTRDMLFIMTPEQHEMATASRKLLLSEPERVVLWPDGHPGFYFVRMSYSPEADEILASEREARRRMVEEPATLAGEAVIVGHSVLDIGSLPDMFDGRPDTLLRGMEANPFLLEVSFPKPKKIAKVHLMLGAMNVIRLKVLATPGDGKAPVVFEKSYSGFSGDPVIDVFLPGGPVAASKIRIEIEDYGVGETSHVHVRELSFE